MLQHLGLLAVCACVGVSVGCDGGKVTAPAPPPPPSTVTVEFGGRVVNADVGGPVANVGVSPFALSSAAGSISMWSSPPITATSGGDGAFTFALNLPSVWRWVSLNLTAPPGYDDRDQRFEPKTPAERPEIPMYPTLVIRPGESIEVRVDGAIAQCGWGGEAGPCRRVLVAAPSDDPVEIEVVSDDSSKPMALALAIPEYPYLEPDDMSVRRLMVPRGGVPYVLGAGTARLTARR